MNIKQLEYFISVAESLSFTKATEKHYISQTAVTQQIKSLEELLQVQLLKRTKRQVELTPTGKIFLDEARSIVNHVSTSILKTQEFNSGLFGSLHIGAVIGYEKTDLSKFLQKFSHSYPNISLDIRCDGMTELLNLIKHNLMDIAFVINPKHQPIKDFNFKTIKHYSLIAVLPSTHSLSRSTSIDLKELKDENFIFVKETSDEYGQKTMIQNRYRKAGFRPNITQRCNDLNTILSLIASNLGVAVLPSFTIINTDLNNTNISVVPLNGDTDEVEVIAVWNKNATNPALKQFIDII